MFYLLGRIDRPTSRKGLVHMTTTTTHTQQVTCPGMCGATSCGELVEVMTSPKAKTVRFAACTKLLAQGWKGHQMAIVKADAARYGVMV